MGTKAVPSWSDAAIDGDRGGEKGEGLGAEEKKKDGYLVKFGSIESIEGGR